MTRAVGGRGSVLGGLADASDSQGADYASENHQHQFAETSLELTYQGTFSTYSTYLPARIYRVGNLIQIEGVVKNTGADRVIALIPLEFRPENSRLPMYFPSIGVDSAGNNFAQLEIDTANQLKVSNFGGLSPPPYNYMGLNSVKYAYK